MLGHFIGKSPLHLQQVGHFTGKSFYIENGIQAYNPLERKMQLHWKCVIQPYCGRNNFLMLDH